LSFAEDVLFDVILSKAFEAEKCVWFGNYCLRVMGKFYIHIRSIVIEILEMFLVDAFHVYAMLKGFVRPPYIVGVVGLDSVEFIMAILSLLGLVVHIL
jgi:hypothetical protein